LSIDCRDIPQTRVIRKNRPPRLKKSFCESGIRVARTQKRRLMDARVSTKKNVALILLEYSGKAFARPV
jgi:hypothetical protein